MITLSDSQDAARRLQGFVHQTPVLTSTTLDSLLGKQLFFKAEHLQKTGSFKIRGALNAALQAGDVPGFIAFSSGNHAQALAYAAKLLGKPAIILMPFDASKQKIKATKAHGADVRTEGVTIENREALVTQLAAETGYRLIPPYNDEQVMAGQGTLALEFLQQTPGLEAILVPIGGGGLISGVATVVKSLLPQVKVIGVEPENANDAQQSLRAGQRIALPTTPKTIADGVRTITLGDQTFPHIQKYVDAIITAPDNLIAQAQMLIMERLKQVVEPTAALSLAPLLADNNLPTRIGIVLTGGNWLPKIQI
ncbi:MAG TPA: threonine/serine dehydratase [Candidatus Acidoferrum sp.]|nr:threonine/serine dehydratase [Candidatus Acidoferrum sp.]